MTSITLDDIRDPGKGGARRGPLLRRVAVIGLVAIVAGAVVASWVSNPSPTRSTTLSAAITSTPQEAIARFEQMTADQPDDARAWQNLAITYVQGVAAGEPLELYNRAEAAIDQARALAPGDRMNDVAAGYLGLARHDFATARVHGLAAHESDPFDSNALAILIDAEIELGNYTAAGQRIEELLALRPGLAAYSRLSYFRELNGDIDGAREAFALAETAGAGSVFDLANVAVLRGKLAVADGNTTEAASAFERARQHVATASGATAGEARVLIARGEYARATAQLEQAMVDEPSAENALLLRDLYLFQGSTAGVPALDQFLDDNAAEERAAGADVDLELGIIEADRGNAAEAVRLAQRAYDTRPENVFTASGLAWALHVAGDDASALPYVDRSLRLGTQDAVFRYRAAVVLAANGQTDRAAQELATAFSINPAFSLARHADACALAGDLGVECPALQGT